MCERGWTNADETRLMNIENKTTASTQSRKLRVFFSDVNNPQKFARMAYRDVSQLTWSFNVYQVPYVTLVTAIALLLNVFARIARVLRSQWPISRLVLRSQLAKLIWSHDQTYLKSWPNLFEVMTKLIWSHDQTYLKSWPNLFEVMTKLIWSHDQTYLKSWPNLFEVMIKLIWSHDQTYLKSLPEENLEINDEVLWYLIDPIKNHWLLSEVSL